MNEAPSLRHSSAFRQAMAYTLGFCLLSLLALSLVYLHILREVNKQIGAGLAAELTSLVAASDQMSDASFTQLIAARSTLASIRNSNRNDAGPRFYLLLDSQGQRLAGSLPDWRHVITEQGSQQQAYVHLATYPDIARMVEYRTRFLARSYQAPLDDGRRLLVAQALNEVAELREEMRRLLMIFLPLMVGIGVAGGWWIGRSTAANLAATVAAADRIMAGDLTQRLPVQGRDELAYLSQHLNLMLSRIEELMSDLREVAESVAHDLRTPLTRLRSRAELALAQAEAAPRGEALATVIRETDALIRLLEAILGIARVEAGSRIEWQTLDLAAICHDAIDFYEPLAEARHLTLTGPATDSHLSLSGNPHLLAQAIGNLLDNAIKYTPAGGHIQVALTSGRHETRISVTDSGPGIPPELRDKALQRFVRLDNSRSLPGNGLGLALVAAVMRHHNGTLELEDAEPGLRVLLRFPANMADLSST